MIFHIAVCSPDPVLRGRVERQCLEYYARRADACIVEQLPGVDALLARDAEGTRYELYLVELTVGNAPAGLKAADTLRRHGVRAPLAFFAHTPAHAYNAYRVDAMQYLLLPFRPEQFTALLDRATEPEYGPVIAVSTAAGLRALPFADIEYLECTHHVVHFHLATGEDVPSLSLRVPFAEVAKPLLADDRFLQPHRSYVVNLAAVDRTLLQPVYRAFCGKHHRPEMGRIFCPGAGNTSLYPGGASGVEAGNSLEEKTAILWQRKSAYVILQDESISDSVTKTGNFQMQEASFHRN